MTSPQHPTQNDISVHVQSDGYDVIFAVAPINAVSITVGIGSAQSIAASNLFVEDTTVISPTYQAYVYWRVPRFLTVRLLLLFTTMARAISQNRRATTQHLPMLCPLLTGELSALV